MNEVDPETLLKPGTARSASNFECDTSAQPRRVDGYERYDGNPSIWDETYYILPFTGGNTNLANDTAVFNGTTVNAYGTIRQLNITSGTLAGGDAAGTLVLAHFYAGTTFGVWNVGNSIKKFGGPAPVCATVGAGTQGIGKPPWEAAATGYVVDTDYKIRKRLVDAGWRAGTAVRRLTDGTPVLGVWIYNDVVYGFFYDGSQTKVVMKKASATGWLEVVFKKELRFTAGSGAQPADGATITKGAASAVVRRTCLEGGTWEGGTARGRFIIDDPSGGNFSAGAFTAGVTATCSGVQTQITLAAGGRFEFVNWNFYGASDRFRMYGCDGVNRAFEFDSIGEVFAPISTGMATDAPNHIEAHRDYLFLAFSGGSVQNSGVGNPHGFTLRAGANEFGMGDDVNGMKSVHGGTLAIMARNSAKMLYGTTSNTWDLKPWLKETGCLPYCLLEVAQQPLAFDLRGAYFVEQTQNFGDFQANMLTRPIGNTVAASAAGAKGMLLVRKKGQARVYFNDKTGITGTFFGSKLLGWMPFTVAHQFVCFASGEINGVERLFAGTDTGYVMELDKGENFDGAAIASSLRLVANDLGMPENNKRFHKAEFDLSVTQDLTLTLTVDIDFGRVNVQQTQQTITVPGSSRVAKAEFLLDGEGVSMAPTLSHSDDYEPAFTLQMGRVMHTVRGRVRG